MLARSLRAGVDLDRDRPVLTVGLLGIRAERHDILRAELFLDALGDLADLRGARDVKDLAPGLVGDLVDLLADSEVENGDSDADEVDRRAAGARVAQERRVIDVGWLSRCRSRR
jgi:hypothetical protein